MLSSHSEFACSKGGHEKMHRMEGPTGLFLNATSLHAGQSTSRVPRLFHFYTVLSRHF